MSENGKGDKPRPISVDRETFERNWEMAFGRKITNQKKKDENNESTDS